MDFRSLKDKNWLSNTASLCAAIVFYFVLKNISVLGQIFSGFWKLVYPLVLGCIFAYLLDPIARWLEKRVFVLFVNVHPGRKAAVISSGILVLLTMLLLIAMITPATINSLSILLGNLDKYEESLLHFLSSLGFSSGDLQSEMDALFLRMKDAIPVLTQQMVSRSVGTLTTLLNMGIGYVLAIYILLDKEKILPVVVRMVKKFVPEEYYPTVRRFLLKCNEIMLRYLSCSILEAFLVGTVNAIFMAIFGIPMVMLISVLVGVTNLAPDFGPLFGCVVGTFILFLIRPYYGILFLIFTVIIQTVDSYVIKPLLFGGTFGVSALWILLAIIWGGKLFGVVGLLLAIPFAAIAQYTVEEILFPKAKEETNRSSSESE